MNVFLEDCIMQEGTEATAGSKILKGFVSPFNATVVDRLLDKGHTIAGRVAMDEFGIVPVTGSNIADEAIKVATDGACVLCNDALGMYRRIVAAGMTEDSCYIHPTYGTVSRHGLIPTVSSMDQIGVLCKNVEDGFTLLRHIAGHDHKDGAMFPDSPIDFDAPVPKTIRVGIPGNFMGNMSFGRFRAIPLQLVHSDVYQQVMYILTCAEISNNISRYDGIKFGHRATEYKGVNDLYVKTRSEGFGLDAKMVAIMGAMVLSQDYYTPYYEKAMKIRRLIKESLLFDTYDIILLHPGMEPLAALAGLPSVSFSSGGQGIQLIANVGQESLLLSAWKGMNQV